MTRFIFIFLICTSGLSQELIQQESQSLSVDIFIGIDDYNDIYTITDNIIYKTGEKGTFEFNDLQLGDITSVDIINPLKVIVYYHDFNTVVFLDNRLSEIERIDFNNLPTFINTGAARNAGNNRLWLLNTDTQQIELYNYSTQKELEISQPITDEIIATASNFNFFYTLTNQELTKYNLYGSLVYSIKIEEGKTLHEDFGNIIVTTASQLLYKAKEEKKFTPLAYQEILNVNLQLRQDLLYIYNGEKLTTFSLNQPKK